MLLSRIHLNPRCREARRDLADPYQLHSTLCRAFSPPYIKCPAGEFMWRIEPEEGLAGLPRILVQSRLVPRWEEIGVSNWLAMADPAIDLRTRMNLDALQTGQRFRFRLRANPSITRRGKRLGLLTIEEQVGWLERKGELHGFALPAVESPGSPAAPRKRLNVWISQPRMLQGRSRSGNTIRVFSALYDGVLEITAPGRFREALEHGIGHGKAMGLGLLSIAPAHR
jgi:CRISPR system Cascade subunit CasE